MIKACLKWHPDTPQRLAVQSKGKKLGMRQVCRECNRVRLSEWRERRREEGIRVKRSNGQARHVVVPLNWAPPRF